MNVNDFWKNENKKLTEMGEAIVKSTTNAYSVQGLGWTIDEDTFKALTGSDSIDGNSQRVLYDVNVKDTAESKEDVREYMLTWDMEQDCFTACEVRKDTAEDGKILTRENSQLPSHILQCCEYVGQPLHTSDLSGCSIDTSTPLDEPVTDIRMAYPFKVERGSYNVYAIKPAHTWGELLTETVRVFQDLCDKGLNITFHGIEDFIIERVDVHPNNLATIGIGS
jgi:hypothetical protein